MKYTLCLVFIIISFISFSQPNVDFSSQKTEKGVGIYATNPEYCPVSVKMSFTLNNMSPSTGKQNVFVVPAKAKNYLLTELLKVDDEGGYKFSYKFKMNFGDITLSEYDSAFEYDLPFEKGKSCLLFQGYNGSFSHQNENALDFAMPEGSNVVAARDGVVIRVVQNNTKSCPNRSCLPFSNYINIYHNDGTIATYAHLCYQGTKVNVGDSVKQGNIIGLSGRTGFTSGPHLHFACYLPGLDKRRTVETYFKINDGTEVTTLQEKDTYFKNY